MYTRFKILHLRGFKEFRFYARNYDDLISIGNDLIVTGPISTSLYQTYFEQG